MVNSDYRHTGLLNESENYGKILQNKNERTNPKLLQNKQQSESRIKKNKLDVHIKFLHG